jgi:hypothetical protein
VVQTHASYVFLADQTVYKIKKPVDFGFLDFSTLARRHRFCRREVELNRRLAPDVYLDVVPIRRAGRSFTFDGNGDIVEYAVRMRRLPKAGFASERISRGSFGPREIDRLAATLTRFYRTQAGGLDGPLPDRQRRSIDDNLRLIRRHASTDEARGATAALSSYTRAFYASHAALLARRRRERRILDCHGDLRLEHVHVDRQSIRIYDCIEFNDRLRTIDVANDVAFLAMDLDYEGRPDLARRFVNAIARATRDREMAGLVDFYKCYRAAVRHEVESLRAAEREVRVAERRASAKRAGQLLALALRYATVGSHSTVIVVMGEVACGKSTLAQGIAEALGVTVVSSDVVRKKQAGIPLRRRPSEVRRKRLYDSTTSRRVYAALIAEARAALREGRNVILDATFARRADRDRIRAGAKRAGGEVVFIEVVTPATTRRRRLATRGRAGSSISDARLQDFAALASRYEPPTELEPASLLCVRSRKTAAETLSASLRALARARGRK